MDDDEELANENDHSDSSREDASSTKVDLDRLLSDVGAFGR